MLFCEEFDGQDENAVGAIPEAIAPSATVHAQAMSRADPSVELKGLCGTCEKRATCTFPRAEEGIWHCEEFE